MLQKFIAKLSDHAAELHDNYCYFLILVGSVMQQKKLICNLSISGPTVYIF